MADPRDIAEYLNAMEEPAMALEVLTMHNRLEAFSQGIDRDAFEAMRKAFDDVLKQRNALLSIVVKIVTETMDCPPVKPTSADSWIPRELVSEAQSAITEVRGYQVPTYKEPTP